MLDKAAVLVCRLAWNHPLLDGSTRAAWVSMAMFLEVNGCTFDPDPPDVDEAEAFMLAVAAHDMDEQWVRGWLDARVVRARDDDA